MPDPYPDVAALLAHLNELFPALGTAVTDADEARRLFAALRRPVAQPTPVRAVTETVAARDHGGVVPLRHYSPATRADGAPVVLFLHGGGWVLGGFDSHDELCRRLANGIGATVTAVDYRLAPEHPFPAALEDAAAALRHVVATSPQGTRVVVAGDSAGGNLAAALCLLTRDEAGPEIAGQLLLYPMTDQACDSPSYRDNGQGFYITADHLRWFWSQYLRYETDGASRYVSLLRANLQGLPPGRRRGVRTAAGRGRRRRHLAPLRGGIPRIRAVPRAACGRARGARRHLCRDAAARRSHSACRAMNSKAPQRSSPGVPPGSGSRPH